MPRTDDISLALVKAKKRGYFPDVLPEEVDALERDALSMLGDDWQPTDETLTSGESAMPRYAINTSAVATTSGFLRLTFFTAKKTEMVTAIRYNIGATAAGATPTLFRLGLYLENPDKSLTLVASTPNDTAAMMQSTFTAYTKNLSVPYLKLRNQRYAIGFLIVTAAATPSVYGNNAQVASAAFSDPKIAAAVSGYSDLPATQSAGGLGTTANIYYLEVV